MSSQPAAPSRPAFDRAAPNRVAPPAPPGIVRDPRWVADFVLTTVVALFCVAPYSVGGPGRMALVSLLLCASLLVRRQLPRVGVIWASAAALLQVAVISQPTLSIVVVPMMVYAAARWTDRPIGLGALLLGLLGAVLGPIRWAVGSYYNPLPVLVTAIACAAIITGSYLLGRRLHEQQENFAARAQAAAERARLQQAEADQRARVVAVDERSRIARELHDIVAHSLSVMVVQAEGGRAVAVKKPEVAAEVLGTIAETGRDALGEMRRIVDLLRGERSDAVYLPSPGLADLPDLVRRTGPQFELLTFGDEPQVPPTVGLTAYRIVQESLTNVLKHGGPHATARVTIAYTPVAVEIDVTDTGRGAAASFDPASAGHGLQGMTERVAVLGGRLATGPRPGGGFAVRATLPIGVRG